LPLDRGRAALALRRFGLAAGCWRGGTGGRGRRGKLAAGILEKTGASIGQLGRLRIRVEQLDAELCLELPNGCDERCARHVEALRGTSEMQFLGGGDKVPEQCWIHGAPLVGGGRLVTGYGSYRDPMRPVIVMSTIAALVASSFASSSVQSGEVSPVRGESAITSMWAWGNAVPASVDYRGRGEVEFAPAAVARFASDRRLGSVRLSVPWAADEGAAISSSLRDTVDALHADGIVVSALGGDDGWVDDPALVDEWMTAAHNVTAFDAVQLDVEPWTDPHWTTDTAAVGRFIAMAARAQLSAHGLGMTLGVDVPWWLADKRYGSSTILEALLPHLDSLSIVTFVDHAAGDDGIVALSAQAASQAAAAAKPFTIGVETDTPEVAGGAQYTFNDGGSAVLESAAATVRIAYGSTPGYGGVTVEHYLSWLRLKP
jgi:hypothetical protein